MIQAGGDRAHCRLPCQFNVQVTTYEPVGFGKESAGDCRCAAQADFYLATSCHSRERGLNGHANGLVRWHFPKGTDFRKVKDARVREVGERLDNRPHKARATALLQRPSPVPARPEGRLHPRFIKAHDTRERPHSATRCRAHVALRSGSGYILSASTRP